MRETPAQTIQRLRKWIDDLQSGMYINCVYCGHRYGPAGKVATSMQDVLKQHIAVCPEHPMHQILQVLKAGRDLVATSIASHGRAWLSSANDAIDKAERTGSHG